MSNTSKIMGEYVIWCLILPKRNDNDSTAKKEITIISMSCRENFPKARKLIRLFWSIKLKKRTPKMSDKLLSYTINSLLNEVRFLTLGMAIALLITQKGIALMMQSVNEP